MTLNQQPEPLMEPILSHSTPTAERNSAVQPYEV